MWSRQAAGLTALGRPRTAAPRAGSTWPWLRNVPTRLQKTTSSFIPDISSQCLPIWVPVVGGEPGERLCRLDANPEIGFLLHCIPATGLQLVGGGGEVSGAGPGDPSAFYSIQLPGVGSRAEAVREAPVQKAGNQEVGLHQV